MYNCKVIYTVFYNLVIVYHIFHGKILFTSRFQTAYTQTDDVIPSIAEGVCTSNATSRRHQTGIYKITGEKQHAGAEIAQVF